MAYWDDAKDEPDRATLELLRDEALRASTACIRCMNLLALCFEFGDHHDDGEFQFWYTHLSNDVGRILELVEHTDAWWEECSVNLVVEPLDLDRETTPLTVHNARLGLTLCKLNDLLLIVADRLNPIRRPMVTLNQVAEWVFLGPKSMAPYKSHWPQPAILQSGRRPARWYWGDLLPVLRWQFPHIEFPETPPAD